jgi:hypothetical protein
MSSFTVDPQSLTALAGTLAGLGSQMTALSKLPSSSGTALGGGDVLSSVEDFCGHWKYGVSQLDSHLKTVIQNLTQAARNYNTSDACVADSAASQ